jgi:hypothetical protein
MLSLTLQAHPKQVKGQTVAVQGRWGGQEESRRGLWGAPWHCTADAVACGRPQVSATATACPWRGPASSGVVTGGGRRPSQRHAKPFMPGKMLRNAAAPSRKSLPMDGPSSVALPKPALRSPALSGCAPYLRSLVRVQSASGTEPFVVPPQPAIRANPPHIPWRDGGGGDKQ